MADQGLWFKLWCAALEDQDLDALDVADFGRWAKLGAHVKQHGTAGTARLVAPARTLCAQLQVPDFAALCACVSRLPHVIMRRANGAVSDGPFHETVVIVTFANWRQYQGDYSTGRVRKFRASETAKKRARGEEKRGEEKRREEREEAPLSPPRPRDRIRFDPSQDGLVGITPEDRVAWAAAFPTLDLEPELAKAGLYLRDHWRRYKDLSAFLRRWLQRAATEPAARGGSPARRDPAAPILTTPKTAGNLDAVRRVIARHDR